jgi:hypothetical protein
LISLFVLGAVSGAQETDSAPHETVLPSGQGLFKHLREELAWFDFSLFVLEIAKDVHDPLHIVSSELINLTDANRDVVTLGYKPIHDPIKGFYERRTGNDFEKGRDDSTLLDTVVFMADIIPTIGEVIKVLFIEKDLSMLNPIDEIKDFHARQTDRFDTSIRFIFGLPKKPAEKNKLESQEGINEIDPNSDLHMDDAVPEEGTEEAAQAYALAVIAALDADYYIDYSGGTIPIGDLPIGARVADPSWVWEFRTDNNYSGSGEVKPVTWIVVAKNNYEGLDPHVTLLAEELIGKYTFDNSTNRGSNLYGSNHWGNSGTANSTRGLRPWLNSTGIHSGEGFYRAFSENFKTAVLVTTVPNKEWNNGSTYSTQDRVFLPSTTELGDEVHYYTYRVGDVYAYFSGAGDVKRVARLGGETWWYWTRSPISYQSYLVSDVNDTGEFNYNLDHSAAAWGYLSDVFYNIVVGHGVRPALNLKSGILVSEIRN